ncbi:MAG: GNAT family N-acetyltransferase [Ruminococcus sp.]|nr:GNAT family N-acetyltransferase [Ruminococcus sp.]
MTIRRAKTSDISGIDSLLYQVAGVHHNGRPDLFNADSKKYTDDELSEIISDESKPVFCAVDDSDNVLGYAFCVIEEYSGDGVMTARKTLYIDDLCVDEKLRGRHIGSDLCEAVKQFARDIGCYNITLNVWECNPDAMKFYRAAGMLPYKTGMEFIL